MSYPMHPQQPQRMDSSDSTDALRKRVCKACDRCRLKKSKCDGASPCSRCTADNSICVFGERKKSHDKIYPKGYVEMLEQQQAQLVEGLQQIYHRLLDARLWDGPTLSEATGKPLTHDILAAMGLLEKKSDGSDETIPFEEDPEKLQARLIADGAVLTKRRGSMGSDSERSHRAQSSSQTTPVLSKPQLFEKSFSFTHSPTSRQRRPSPPAKTRRTYPSVTQTQSPLHQNVPMQHNDPQLYQPEWSFAAQSLGQASSSMTKPAYEQKPSFPQSNSTFTRDLVDFGAPMHDSPDFDFYNDSSYGQMFTGFGGPTQDFGYPPADPMSDVDFKSFIATA